MIQKKRLFYYNTNAVFCIGNFLKKRGVKTCIFFEKTLDRKQKECYNLGTKKKTVHLFSPPGNGARVGQYTSNHPMQGYFVCAGTVFRALFLCEKQLEVFGISTKDSKELLINEEIREKEIRVIDADGAQLGIMKPKDALVRAEAQGLDLVMIAPHSEPPVCRIMDYGKYRFERAKKEKEAKKKQTVVDVKEVQLSCRIEMHDFTTKANHARRFIQGGDRVKVVVRFRGREMAHTDIGREVLDKFAEMLSDVAVVDKPAKLEGRNMTMFLSVKPAVK